MRFTSRIGNVAVEARAVAPFVFAALPPLATAPPRACSMLAAYRDGLAPSPAPAEDDVEDAAAPAENPLQDDDARRDTELVTEGS